MHFSENKNEMKATLPRESTVNQLVGPRRKVEKKKDKVDFKTGKAGK